VVIRISFGVLS